MHWTSWLFISEVSVKLGILIYFLDELSWHSSKNSGHQMHQDGQCTYIYCVWFNTVTFESENIDFQENRIVYVLFTCSSWQNCFLFPDWLVVREVPLTPDGVIWWSTRQRDYNNYGPIRPRRNSSCSYCQHVLPLPLTYS